MAQLKVSDRLKSMERLIPTKNSPLIIRVYRILQGYAVIMYLELMCSVLIVVSTMYFKVEEEKMFRNIYVGGSLVMNAETIYFWTNKTKSGAELVAKMVQVAKDLEAISDADQLAKLAKVAEKTKSVYHIYYYGVGGTLVTYSLLPILTGHLVWSVPFLPEEGLYFWIVWALQNVYYFTTPVLTAGFLACHYQSCVSISALNRNLSEHLTVVQDNHRLNLLIQIHQDLMSVSVSLRMISDRLCFAVLSCFMAMLVLNSFVIVRGPLDNFTVYTDYVTAGFVYGFCSLGDRLSFSSLEVGNTAYSGRWVGADVAFRRKIVMMILRAQKPACVTAGLIGTLNLSKFADLTRLWFRYVQALLNLL